MNRALHYCFSLWTVILLDEEVTSMSEPMISISEPSLRILRDLAAETGKTEQAILSQALEDYRRKVFFEGLAADYAALKADPRAWEEELAERKLWETTLMDGLDPSERWSEDGWPLSHEGEGK
jgi:hypothetical protein